MTNSKLTDEQVSATLDFDLFQGDFGSPSDRELSNKIVIGRVKHSCHICAGTIENGEQHRAAWWVFDGELMGYRVCFECCVAAAASVDCDYDDQDPIDARYALGDQHRNSQNEK
ncbi:hypothetical protein YG56_21080 [Salmonella enterica subsp. enterica serovar Kentucky]|nr:hypothetical protein [Salmonella enterica subsp. enterica]ECM8230954.1 hypothetical protein [Salmonella enterica subsp. enterica serovar Kentucky]